MFQIVIRFVMVQDTGLVRLRLDLTSCTGCIEDLGGFVMKYMSH